MCLCLAPVRAQMLLVDRPVTGPAGSGIRLGWTKSPGFLGDTFKVGAPGEVWVIDTLRTWAIPDERSPRTARTGDLYEKLVLSGGIAALDPVPGQPPQPECDCHSLMAIRTSVFRPGSDLPVTGDVNILKTGAGWQVEFPNLHWSVPGGVEIQFGVMGVGRSTGAAKRYSWYNYASVLDSSHSLKAFDAHGKLIGPYTGGGSKLEPNTGFNVQVWGHKVAIISIQSGSGAIDVTLYSDGSLAADKVDASSLRFGSKSATPLNTRLDQSDGKPVLIARFRPVDAGIQPQSVNACLTGREIGGAPFEGCALLNAGK